MRVSTSISATFWAHFLKQWWVSHLFGMVGLISLKESRPPGLPMGQKVLRSFRHGLVCPGSVRYCCRIGPLLGCRNEIYWSKTPAPIL